MSNLSLPKQNGIAAIQSLMNAGRFKLALLRAKQLVAIQPKCAEHWFMLSEVQAHPKVTANPLPAIRTALKLEPNNPRYLAQLANCLLMAGGFSAAQQLAQQLVQHPTLNAYTLDKVGNVFNGCGELLAAYQCFEKAVALEPNEAHFLFNLATLQRALGKLDEAEQSFTQVIVLRPDDSSAYLARSSLRTVTKQSNHVRELKNRHNKNGNHPSAQIRLNYALAKELEDLEDYPQSFQYLKQGSEARRKRMDYCVEHDIDAMAKIQQAFSVDTFQAIPAGFDSDEPIFILGLPRTGTTLVERILSCHSDVYAAGELQNFSIEMVKLAQQTFAGELSTRLKLIEQSPRLDYRELGERYISSTRPRTGSNARFIDKLPLNFLYTGLIHRALPKAKIIHLTRNPMDACYAIYKTLFEQAYPFSYDLEDLGRYYIAYRQLMAHWQKALGDKLLNVSYELLVTEQEPVSRRVMDYCGLEWQAECLQFQHNAQPTATASSAQVRKGMYTSSLQKWRPYEQNLQPLIKLLMAQGIDIEQW